MNKLSELINNSEDPFIVLKKEFDRFYKIKVADGGDFYTAFLKHLNIEYKEHRAYISVLIHKHLILREGYFSEHIPHAKQVLLPQLKNDDSLLKYKQLLNYKDAHDCRRRDDCLECCKKFGDRLIFNCDNCDFFSL